MSRIIFLDIDGVLNCELFYRDRIKSADRPYPQSEICTERVEMLNDLCEETGAKVVISSTWRMSGIERCVASLKGCGATFEIVGVTPVFREDSSVRGNEIYHWIKENSQPRFGVSYYAYKSYAIIDDDSDMLLWQRDHFFQTDTYSGLTPNICHRIKLFFKRTINFEQ